MQGSRPGLLPVTTRALDKQLGWAALPLDVRIIGSRCLPRAKPHSRRSSSISCYSPMLSYVCCTWDLDFARTVSVTKREYRVVLAFLDASVLLVRHLLLIFGVLQWRCYHHHYLPSGGRRGTYVLNPRKSLQSKCVCMRETCTISFFDSRSDDLLGVESHGHSARLYSKSVILIAT